MTPRAYVTNFTISLGPIQLVGRLLPLIQSERARGANKFRQVVPDTDVPVLAKQRYIADGADEADAPTLYTARDLVYALETDDGLAFVSAEDVAEARKSDLPLNVCNVTIHPAETVNDCLFPADNSYVFEPALANEHYAALVSAVADPRFVFLAAMNLRNHEGLFRIVVHNDALVVQKMYWPEDLNEIDLPDVETTPQLVNAVSAMVSALMVDFDPESYTSGVREKVAAINSGEVFSPEAAIAEAEGANLMDLLAGYAEELR
jgi:non-homologous end joining protein Ku